MRHLVAVMLLLSACASSSVGDDGTDGQGSPRSQVAPAAATGGLTFAVVGDTRPPSIDDTAKYPTAIISKIYADIEAESPRPQFAVATGDYQYASTKKAEQQAQLDIYMTARAAFTGPFYPAMGNHECTGYTASNCGTGNADGVTKNYTDFISTMLTPIGQSQPYYVETAAATDGSWTAKFVFIACNAWTTAQASWLGTQLAMPTTYTFVIRHESVADMSETKCSASTKIINAHPLTLLIVGHTHEYAHVPASKEIINGLGGAPLTSGTNYGYTIIGRTSAGTFVVTTYDYMTRAVIDTFQINADGTPTTGTPPSVQVTSPNGGEVWAGGSTQTIQWTSTGVTDVKVELTTDGTTWTTLTASTAAGAGSLAFTVPAVATTAASVRVSSTSGGTPSDTSDAPFTITTTAPPVDAAVDAAIDAPATGSAAVFLNEILANEPGSDTTKEFVELVNGGGAAADLSGWTISDAVMVRHVFAAGTTLQPGKAIVVFGNASGIPAGLTNAVGSSSGSLSLNNGGDSVVLKNGSTTVDSEAYGSALSDVDGVSMNRSPDGAPGGTFVLHTTLSTLDSSPGTRVDGSAF